MATIVFFLQSKSKSSSIYVRLSAGRGKLFKRKTGLIINSSEWSDKKNQPIQNDANTKSLKKKLDVLKIKLETAFNDAIDKGTIINGEWLEEQINTIQNRKPVVNLDLLENYIQYYIDTAPRRKNQRGDLGLTPNRIKSIKTFKVKIQKYQKEIKKTLFIKQINPITANKFKDWLFDQGFSVNYVGKNISNLKTICRDAKKNKIETDPDLNLIESVSENKKRDEIITLSFVELEKIKKVNLLRPALINARKWLILGCYIGQRGSDLLSITEKNIIKYSSHNLIELEQQKTGKKVMIPILPESQKIIDSGLPYKISLVKFNKYIKDICETAELTEPTKGKIRDKKTNKNKEGIYPKYKLIGSHVCRRSFATNYYGNIPTPYLIEITGHSTERMFLKYIGKTSIDNAKQMLDYFNRLQPKAKERPLEVIKHAKSI